MRDPWRDRWRRARLFLLLLALVGVAQARAEQLRARRVVVDRDGVHAEGRVHLLLGRCELRANRIDLGAAGAVEAEQPCLVADGLTLRAHLLSAGGHGARLKWPRVELCQCGGGPRLRVDAREAWRTPGGTRLHLSRPIMRLGPLPLLGAPYWAVPLEPGVSGLLPPEVSYSERDGLRLEQGGYLAGDLGDLTLGLGWVEQRGGRLRSRLRYFTSRGDGELKLSLLRDQGRFRALARGAMVLRSRGWAVGLWPDAASDRRLLSDLALAPGRVFAPYLRSRSWANVAAGPLSAFALGDLFHQLVPSPRQGDLLGRGALQLNLAPTSVVGPVLTMGRARLVAADRGALPQERTLVLLEMAPALALTGGLGAVRLEMNGRYLLQQVWVEGTAQSPAHGAIFGAEAGLPLVRRFAGGRSHTVEPFVGWRAAMGQRRWSEDGRRWAVREGGFGLVGLRTQLVGADQIALLRARALGALSPEGEHRVGGELTAGRALLFEGAAWWLATERRLVQLRLELCSARRGLRLCGGWRRHRFDALWQIAGEDGWDDPTVPYRRVFAGPMVDWAVAALAVTLGPLRGRASVAVDTRRGVLTHGSYLAELPLGCDCFRLGLEGRSRIGQRWPDLALRLSLASTAALDCLLR